LDLDLDIEIMATLKGDTSDSDNDVHIKVKPGLKATEGEDTVIGGDKDIADYGSIISDLTQFKTQDFVGVARLNNVSSGSDSETRSKNDQSRSASDNNDTPPRASLPTFSSTALANLPGRRPRKFSLKQQSQNRHANEKRKKREEKEEKANRTRTRRGKKAEALATTSQLDDTVFVFRSS